MTRFDFLYELRQGLKDFSEEEIMEHIVYYREMIEDRMEDGISEEDALKEIGTPEEVVARIYAETPLPTLIKTKLKKERYIKGWQIVLIILGSPIWLSLLIAVFAVFISLIAAAFAVIAALYTAPIALGASSIATLCLIIPMIISSNIPGAVACLGLSLFCTGASILTFLGINLITKLIIKLFKKIIKAIKSRFIRKEEAK